MPRSNLDQRKIIEAAASLANEISIKKLNLKLLAERLNIKPPSLYNHVESLEHLRRDLTVYGWNQVSDRIAQALIGVSGDAAIRMACNVFFDFAQENPGLFEAMAFFNRSGGKAENPAAARLDEILARLCAARGLKDADATDALRIFRSYLEGYALLANHAVFSPDRSIRESFARGVDCLIAGL